MRPQKTSVDVVKKVSVTEEVLRRGEMEAGDLLW